MAAYNIIYSAAGDSGAVGTGAIYLNARSNTGTTGTTGTSKEVSNRFATPNYTCGQAFFIFDTSAVAAGAGTGLFSFNNSGGGFNAEGDKLRIREVSAVSNKIAGASLSALTLHSDPGTNFPTAVARFTMNVIDVSVIPRSATFNVVMHTVGEENATVPTGNNSIFPNMSEATGTTNDPFLQLNVGAWEFLGVSSVVEVTATPHALVTTGLSTLQAGDLLIACISSRIASTTPVTLPTGGEWTLVSQQNNNNIASNTTAAPSGTMAYCVRGASNPNFTFTHPTAPSVALGRLVAYRNVNQSSPKDTQTSFTTTSTVSVSGTGLTTAEAEELIVAMCAGGQEAAWSVFDAATAPSVASGATNTSTAPTLDTWIERADSLTTTGVDTSLAIFDAVKTAAGATGNLTATASLQALHVVIAGAFRIYVPPVTGVGDADGTGAATATGAQTAATDGASAGTGTASAVGDTAGGATASGDGDADGVGAAAAEGAQTAAAAGSASGSGASAVVGAATAAAEGSSAGAGASSVVGAQTDAAVGSASGAGAASGEGAQIDAAAAAADGTGTAASIGAQTSAADGTAAGTGDAAGVGDTAGVTASGDGDADGAGAAAAVGTAITPAAASADGIGTATAAGAQTDAATATAAGTGTASAIGEQTAAATAAASGTGTAVAASAGGTATVEGIGAAAGTGAASAAAELTAEATGTASGTGAASGRSIDEEPPVEIPAGGGFALPVAAIVGVGHGILPELEGWGRGTVGIAGQARAILPALVGRAIGDHALAGVVDARLYAFTGMATAHIGVAGGVRGLCLPVEGAAIATRGSVGQASASVKMLRAGGCGHHDPDEAAIIAFLMAA